MLIKIFKSLNARRDGISNYNLCNKNYRSNTGGQLQELGRLLIWNGIRGRKKMSYYFYHQAIFTNWLLGHPEED